MALETASLDALCAVLDLRTTGASDNVLEAATAVNHRAFHRAYTHTPAPACPHADAGVAGTGAYI